MTQGPPCISKLWGSMRVSSGQTSHGNHVAPADIPLLHQRSLAPRTPAPRPQARAGSALREFTPQEHMTPEKTSLRSFANEFQNQRICRALSISGHQLRALLQRTERESVTNLPGQAPYNRRPQRYGPSSHNSAWPPPRTTASPAACSWETL